MVSHVFAVSWGFVTHEPDDAAFFAMSLDLMCVAGFDGYWKRLNGAWTRTLGWTTDELMGRPLVEFAHPEDRERILAARAGLVEGTPLKAMVNRYLHKDGTYRWLSWRSVSDPVRRVVYAVARDVTAEKRAERQLMLADRLASLGTLAAGVAHEINNPLTYVTTNLELMLEEIEARPELSSWRELAIEAREGALRIGTIVRGLKTFARAEDERRAVIEIVPVIELAIRMTDNEIRHRARLVREFGATPRVLADDARLGQVVINLLVNAAQAIPDDQAGAHEIRVSTSTDADGHAVIEIADTGPGIPAALLERIFDPFFTTKPIGVGTGLGLSICHGLVESMGGTISAANGARGAVFRVVLPAAAGAPMRAPAIAHAPATRRASVLIVDDEPAVAGALARVLRDHDVTVATSAEDALARIATGARYDVIVSDVMMPGMSGEELHAELARRDPEIAGRVVFITGGAFTPAARAFLDRVPNERLDKPIDPVALRAVIARRVA